MNASLERKTNNTLGYRTRLGERPSNLLIYRFFLTNLYYLSYNLQTQIIVLL